MHISLRANEKIYVNGAVLKVDRKTSIQLMNDAVFLLEAHVMVERDATTPLRQLYYIVQLMLMAPGDVAENRIMFGNQHAAMLSAYEDQSVLDGLARMVALVREGRYFETLKLIRTLLPVEERILAAESSPALAQAS